MKTKNKPNMMKELKVKEVDSEIEVPFVCPSCNYGDYVIVSELPTQLYSGVKNGEEFSRIERSMVRCACGQHSVLTRYVK